MAFKNKMLPTLRQIGYLETLENLKNQTGVIMEVARRCNTNHGTVSRFFKTCVEHGILTEENQLTEYGKGWLHGYQSLIADIKNRLSVCTISEEEMDLCLETALQQIPLQLMRRILAGSRIAHTGPSRISVKQSLSEGIKSGKRIGVSLCFYRMEGKFTDNHFSMAKGGFCPNGFLDRIHGKPYLELTTREMVAKSRMDGRVMSGYLRTLKYNDCGFLREAGQKDDHVWLPLDAFRLSQDKFGRIRGSIAVTVTCSVGDEHMPESTAALVFWV